MGWCVGSQEAVWNRGGRRIKTDEMVCWRSGSSLEQRRECEGVEVLECTVCEKESSVVEEQLGYYHLLLIEI